MYDILLVIYVIAAIAVVGLVMIQQGKGADMGASFGSGASGTVFGSSGSGNFLTRMTAVCAAIFFIISLMLGNMGTNSSAKKDNWADLQAPVAQQTVVEKPEATNVHSVPAAVTPVTETSTNSTSK